MEILREELSPRLLYISKTDEENSDYNAAFNTLRERFGKNIAPVVAPIWDESKKVIGIIDVLHKRAFEFGPGGGRVEIEVPENKRPCSMSSTTRSRSPSPRRARNLWKSSSPVKTSPMPR